MKKSKFTENAARFISAAKNAVIDNVSGRNSRNSRPALFLITAAFLLTVTGCADSESVTGCLEGHTYGFWGGLCHGLIAPFDFIGMLIWDDVAMYAPNNNGAWYAFGFLFGSGGWGVLAGRNS
jgi:hypothetical protein